MERNRPVATIGVIIIVLAGLIGTASSIMLNPEHPIRAALITIGVILGGILLIAVVNVVVFAPLLRLLGLTAKPARGEKYELE